MASTREERMQQRLRGAQKRQVKDVDFGLTFAPVPTLTPPPPILPVPTRTSPRRSLEVAPQPSTRQTPVSRARSQPPISTPSDENISSVINPSGGDTHTSAKYANISAKRRKLDTDESSTSMRSAQSSLPAPRRDVYALGEEEQPRTDAAEITNRSFEQPTRLQPRVERDTSVFFVPQTSARSPTQALGEEEITESPTHAPGSGQRTRTINKAIIQTSRLQDELQVDNAAEGGDAGSPTPKRKRKRPTSSGPSTAQSRRIRQTSISEFSNNDHEPVDEIDELSPDQPKRGRRRRSSIHRASLANTVREESVDERESAEEIDDTEAATISKQNRGRRISRRAPAEPSPDLDERSELVLPIPRMQGPRPQQASSPAKQRHPTNANQKVNPSKKQAKKQIRSGSPIPVTVHRLTNGLTYDNDEADADIPNSDIPHSKRRGVNVIDVLNKLCTEIIDSALETLKDNLRNTQEPVLKREYRNKHKVVEAFGREFNNRLLEHTINLDNTAALEKRLREEQKKKLALRGEISRVRAERQKVALHMDEVRIKHERESKLAQDRDTLNTAVHDIELAVERGKERKPHDPAHPIENSGVELLLKRIAGDISNKSDSGMSNTIKEFNAFLERAALALEGRKA